MADELLAAHAAGRIRVAIGRSSDYFGPGRRQLGGRRAAVRRGRGRQATALARRASTSRTRLSYLPDTAAGLVTLGERDEADGRVWHLPVAAGADRARVGRAAGIGGGSAAAGSARISRPMLDPGRALLAAHPRAARHALPVGAPVGDGRLGVPTAFGGSRRPSTPHRAALEASLAAPMTRLRLQLTGP